MRLTPIVLLATALFTGSAVAQERTLLNVSYDVTREFYQDYNALFATYWKDKTGDTVVVNQSHGGSGKQARAIIDGLAADVVTMNQALDIDQIASKGRQVPADWATKLPNNAVPNSSAIVFLVRGGNPKAIKDWSDLVKPGVRVIIPNPKTSGNGRYSYLAAWSWAKRANGGDEAKAKAFVKELFTHVPVLDAGGRAATTTFVKRAIGDVLLTFESEVALITKESGPGAVSVVLPSLSIRADNPVAVVEKVAAKHGTTDLANAYLSYLYSPEAQELAAKHNVRPSDPAILAKHRDRFPELTLVDVDEAAGGWSKALAVHFSDGGIVDQILEK